MDFGFNSFAHQDAMICPADATRVDLGPTIGPSLGGGQGSGRGQSGQSWWNDRAQAADYAQPATEQAAQAPPPVDLAKVRQRATALWRAMDGWGTDEAGVFTALRGLNQAEMAALRAEFRNHYNRDLDAMIADEMSGRDLAEARALMTANPVEAVLAGLDNSVGFFNDDEAKIDELLRGLSDDDRQALVKHRRWPEVRARVRGALGGSDLQAFDAYERGDKAGAAAIRLDDAMGASGAWYNPFTWGTDEQAVYDRLADMPAEDRAQIESAYNERMRAQGNGSNLREHLESELSGADLDRAVAVLEANTIDEQVARLLQTMEGLGTNEAELFRLLEDQSLDADMRQAVVARFNELHGDRWGSLDEAIASETSGLDLERANNAVANGGRQDPAFMLFFAMTGFGTDEQLIRDTLKGKSAAEIDAMRAAWNREFAGRYGANFDDAFRSELSGRDYFDIVEIQLRGEPQNDEERAVILEMQYDYERGERSTLLGRSFMDLADMTGYSSSASQMDMQYGRLQSLYNEDGAIDAPEGAMASLYAWSQDDLQDYRAAKDRITDALATGAEILVAAIVTVCTKGAAAPWLVAVLSGVAGGAAGIAARAAMQGEAYGIEAIGADVLKTLLTAGIAAGAEAVTIAKRFKDLAATFGDGVAAELAEAALKGSATGLLNGAVEGAFNEDAMRAGAAEYLASIGRGAGTGMITGAVTSAAGKGAESALQPHVDMTTMQGTVFMSAATSTVKGVTGTAINPGSYTGSTEDIVLRFLQSAGKGAVSGAIDGAVDYQTRARVVSRQILVDGKHPDQISDFEHLSAAQKAEVLERVLRASTPPPAPEVLARLGYQPDLTPSPVLTPRTDAQDQAATTVRETVVDPGTADEQADLQRFREQMILNELVRLDQAGHHDFVDRVLEHVGDVDAMESMLMRAQGGAISGGGSMLGDSDVSTSEGARQVLLNAGVPPAQVATLSPEALDAMTRYAQAYSRGDLTAASDAHSELTRLVPAGELSLVEGALVAHHYGISGAQDTGVAAYARASEVLSDGFEATPQELADFRAYMGPKYDEYLAKLRTILPANDPAWSMMSEAEMVAVYGYTTNDYTLLNPALRSLDRAQLDELMPYIAAAESGLQKLPSLADQMGGPSTTIRGTGALPPQLDAALVPGGIFSDRAFYSTSQIELDNFSGDFKFVIEGLTGRPVAFLSEYGHEFEVLYPPGTMFRVTDRQTDASGLITIHMQEIP